MIVEVMFLHFFLNKCVLKIFDLFCFQCYTLCYNDLFIIRIHQGLQNNTLINPVKEPTYFPQVSSFDSLQITPIIPTSIRLLFHFHTDVQLMTLFYYPFVSHRACLILIYLILHHLIIVALSAELVFLSSFCVIQFVFHLPICQRFAPKSLK